LKKLSPALCIAVISMLMVLAMPSYGYEIPYDNSNTRSFYVFGADGDTLMGAEEKNTMEIFIDVPASDPNDVTIGIYDPDTGGAVDWRKTNSEWDTTCEVSISGRGELDTKEFGLDPQYDRKVYTFGPYSKDKGEKVGEFYRFKVTVKGVSGDDENLFSVRITPKSAESFSPMVTFRLLPNEGDKMFFFPQVKGGTEYVVVHNYDLDSNGGTSTISADLLSKKYPVSVSRSGEWASTKAPIAIEGDGRLAYVVTKATQRYANAGVRFEDDKGNTLPIYFRSGPAPKAVKPAPIVAKPELKCNKYTFDATSSYDVDKQNLSYLWDFGDGTTSTEPVITHIFERGGEYTVTLTVKDDSGLDCDSAVTSQRVFINTPPIAAFSLPSIVCTGDTVSIDASATTDDTPEKLTYKWNLGDGTSAEGSRVSHTYAKGGTYTVH